MKVAVIGAGGFIGTQVARHLAAQSQFDHIALLDRGDFPVPVRKGVERLSGDMRDATTREILLDGADAVIVLASILGGAAEADYALARAVNVDATLNLFEYLREHNPRARTVFASTIAVFSEPMPDPVTDITPTGPTMVYGAQKLMMEVALSNFTAKGWLDGVSLRPSGVMARDGADAALKTAFMSRLFWCVKRGQDITLPVAEESSSWMASVDNVAQNFVHATTCKLGSDRALTLPALSLTYGELVSALRRKYPDSPSQVSFEPDPEIVAAFGSYPGLETDIADRLGFTQDADADALVLNAMQT